MRSLSLQSHHHLRREIIQSWISLNYIRKMMFKSINLTLVQCNGLSLWKGFDISTAVMTLSGFRVATRKGHLDRAKQIYWYLIKMRNSAICVCTEKPDFSSIPGQEFDWAKTVYRDVKEQIPDNIPTPLGRFVTLSHYVDDNLLHGMMTGRCVTGILHCLNKTPIDWYSKKQDTVETATYGSEFVAAHICTEQVIDLHNTLHYLGVPIREKSYMFGDNNSVVNSSSLNIPSSTSVI
jgi:hypothetical protein